MLPPDCWIITSFPHARWNREVQITEFVKQWIPAQLHSDADAWKDGKIRPHIRRPCPAGLDMKIWPDFGRGRIWYHTGVTCHEHPLSYFCVLILLICLLPLLLCFKISYVHPDIASPTFCQLSIAVHGLLDNNNNNFSRLFVLVFVAFIVSLPTRNTFCGMWYLPHSQVHNKRMAGCIANKWNVRIFTSGLKSDVTIVCLDPNFL